MGPVARANVIARAWRKTHARPHDSVMKKAAWMVAIALVLVSSVLGLDNARTELPRAAGDWQRSVGYGQIVYGVSGLAAALGLLRQRRWAVPAAVVWAVSAAWVASVASFAFHDPAFQEPGTRGGVIGAAAAMLLLGAFVVWTARAVSRAPRVPESAAGDHIPPS